MFKSGSRPRTNLMRSFFSRVSFALFVTAILTQSGAAQNNPLTWQDVLARFESNNPVLLADQLNIDESKAEEITQYLRPNPSFTALEDGTQLAPYQGVWRPLSGTEVQGSLSYLHERDHKRELRLQAQQENTKVTIDTHADLERTLIFNLRSAFVGVLQAKAIYKLAEDDLAYYDKVLEISRATFSAGGIAQIDMDRLDLQRVQYESELETADVNLRTAKIQLLTMLNDRTPIDKFDVTGTFNFQDNLQPLEEFRQIALDNRPDLKAAIESVTQAQVNYKLAVSNGSTDPTLSAWYTYNPSFNNPYDHQTLGASVSIPLRIFDRNQGEKKRTQLDITLHQRLQEAAEAQVFSDVDTGYATLKSTLNLLRPYKAKYLDLSTRVRDTVTFSYQHGGASLLDFLNAEADYRSVQINYLTLVGTYLTSAAQLNMAVGKEVIQ